MKNKNKLILLLIIILITLILTLIDKSTYKDYSKDYFYMDTYINIKLNSTKNKREIDEIFKDIDYIYDTYHKLTDRYNKYEGIYNIYYLNEELEDNKEILIDKRLADIINLGIEYYDKTDGLFNIASGNLTEVWKEFIDKCDNNIPNNLDSTNINIKDIKLNNIKYIKKNNIKLDLGGISKGYTTKIVSKYLEDNGIKSYIINAGGNVVVGSPYNKDKYTVGITDPFSKNNIFTKVNVKNTSVVTSGNYERYCIVDNKIYSHIINPVTKLPSNSFASVTVVSEDSSLADIYSTYLYMLPLDKGLELVNNNSNIEAIWYIDKDNIVRSKGFNYE